MAAFFAFPLYWVDRPCRSSRRPSGTRRAAQIYWTPENPTIDNYKDILGLSEEEETVFATVRNKDALSR